MKQSERFAGKCIICICDTPFQMMGLLCLFSNELNRSFERCDVIVNPQFPDARAIAERASKEGIFTSVICGRAEFRLTVERLGSRWMLNKHFRESVRDELFANYPLLKSNQYNLLVCSSVTRQSLAVRWWCVPEGKSIFFDDGSGSHNGNVFKPFACIDDVLVDGLVQMTLQEKAKSLGKAMARRTALRNMSFRIVALYLFSPTVEDKSLYHGIDLGTLELPVNKSILERVISPNTPIDLYKDSEVILLTTGKTTPKPMLKAEVELACLLFEKLGKRFRVRLHPSRDSADFAQCSGALLPIGDSWELLLLSGAINDDHVLVGQCSSAQLHPKTLCDLEPKLVMLHRYLPRDPSWSDSAFEQSYESIKCLYRDGERICAPITLEEVIEAVTKGEQRG